MPHTKSRAADSSFFLPKQKPSVICVLETGGEAEPFLLPRNPGTSVFLFLALAQPFYLESMSCRISIDIYDANHAMLTSIQLPCEKVSRSFHSEVSIAALSLALLLVFEIIGFLSHVSLL